MPLRGREEDESEFNLQAYQEGQRREDLRHGRLRASYQVSVLSQGSANPPTALESRWE
jgi:hypothetical protein